MIIDTHVHFYDPSRIGGVPYPHPDEPIDNPLYRTILPNHYRSEAVQEGVTGVVVVEASEWVEDNQWVLDLVKKDTFLVGMVGNLNPYSYDFRRNLNRFVASPFFRGIRVRELTHSLVNNPEGALDSLELLEAKDLELDVHITNLQFQWLFEIIERLPKLRVVINHIADGRPITGNPPSPSWIRNIQRIAKSPSVYCKVSAIVQMAEIVPAPADVNYYRPQLDALWNAFGEDRLIYASNWPNSIRGASYALQQKVVASYFGEKGEEAFQKFFWKNSKDVYKWVDRG